MENINKQEFLDGIKYCHLFGEDFYKKVYGYAYLDKSFLKVVAGELIKIKRKDVVDDYNRWFTQYKAKHEEKMKEVARWYVKECKISNVKIIKSSNYVKSEERSDEAWIRKKKELLLKKKKLIIMQSSKV